MLQFTKISPNNKLKEYVQYYFILKPSLGALDLSNQAMNNHPQGTFDIMFALNGGIELENHAGGKVELGNMFLIAQQEGYFRIRFKPDSQIIGVVFYPEAFNKLFNFPLSEIKNSGRCIDNELSETYHDLYYKLKEAKNNNIITTLLNQFMEEELSKVDFSFTKFDKLIRSIRLSNGKQNIIELAGQGNISERTLQRKVKGTLGIGPKSFSNIMRFKTALRAVVEHPEIDWQDILFQNGYYDQAHFIKEFKKYTGRTPTAFIQSGEIDLSSVFINRNNKK